MKIILGIFLLVITNLPGTSQNVNKFQFIGTITINDGEVLSYKIVFNRTTNNNISGYSITDLYGESLTKTSIIGKYDTTKNILSFKELSNVYTKVEGGDSTFCFVSAEKLKIKNINGSKIITGDFKGRFPSGEICADGKIFLTESNLVKKVKSLADSIKSSQDSSNLIQDSIKVFNNRQEMVLMSKDILLIEYLGKGLILEVWDGVIIDNDKISIYVNDTILKEEITLTGNKKKIHLPVTKDYFKLKIVALNIGLSGVNTVNFAVSDSIGVKEFSSRLNTGESFDVEFRRE